MILHGFVFRAMGFIYGFELSQQGVHFNHQHWKYPQSWNMLYGMLYYNRNVLVVDQKTFNQKSIYCDMKCHDRRDCNL